MMACSCRSCVRAERNAVMPAAKPVLLWIKSSKPLVAHRGFEPSSCAGLNCAGSCADARIRQSQRRALDERRSQSVLRAAGAHCQPGMRLHACSRAVHWQWFDFRTACARSNSCSDGCGPHNHAVTIRPFCTASALFWCSVPNQACCTCVPTLFCNTSCPGHATDAIRGLRAAAGGAAARAHRPGTRARGI